MRRAVPYIRYTNQHARTIRGWRPITSVRRQDTSSEAEPELERGIWDEPPVGPGEPVSDTPYEDNAK